MKVVRIGLWAMAVVLGRASSATAEEATPRVALRWNAPDECPDDAALLSAVEGFLGERVGAAGSQQLSVSLNVTGAAGGFAAKMRFRSASGVEERYLEHPECSKLMEACALLTALAIDPERVKAQQSREHAEPATAAPQAVPAEPVTDHAPAPILNAKPAPLDDDASAAPPSGGQEGAPLRPGLEVVGLASSGVLPKVAPGLGAELGLERGHFKLAIVGRYWLPRSALVREAESGSIELSLWTLGARACALPWLGRWSLRGCLGTDVGDMSGTGLGLERGHTSHALFSALTAGVALRYGGRQLAPVAGVEGAWAIARPTFGVAFNRQNIPTFRADTWNLTGFLGLSYLL